MRSVAGYPKSDVRLNRGPATDILNLTSDIKPNILGLAPRNFKYRETPQERSTIFEVYFDPWPFLGDPQLVVQLNISVGQEILVQLHSPVDSHTHNGQSSNHCNLLYTLKE